MNNNIHIILAIHVTNRIEHANTMQEVMSKYGCYIKTRIGLHDASETYCSTNGIILLELLGDLEQAENMQKELEAIKGLEVKRIVFDHKAENMI